MNLASGDDRPLPARLQPLTLALDVGADALQVLLALARVGVHLVDVLAELFPRVAEPLEGGAGAQLQVRQAVLQLDPWALPFTRFGPLEAAIVLAVMIAFAGIGVHSVVTIVIAAVWLSPLSPDPTLLAMIFLASWGIGLSINPMAGVHLALQGRFGLAAHGLARANLRYCAASYLATVAWFFVVAGWRGVL